MTASCCSNDRDILILACSGGSNVGQITNQAAVELTREGFGKMFCLAGVAAGLPNFVRNTAEASSVLVLDGCPVGCAKAAMDNAGLAASSYLVVTELGIAKVKDRALEIAGGDVEAVKSAAKAMTAPGTPLMGGCRCGS